MAITMTITNLPPAGSHAANPNAANVPSGERLHAGSRKLLSRSLTAFARSILLWCNARSSPSSAAPALSSMKRKALLSGWRAGADAMAAP